MLLHDLLAFAVNNKASDVHLSSGLVPLIRVDGELKQLKWNILHHEDVLKMIHEVMTDNQRKKFDATFEIDFSFELPQLSRFRVNAFMQSRGASIALRVIPHEILSMKDLNLPDIVTTIADYPRGLVLVTGPTGSGKSTTLAAMIEYINQTRAQHVLTIEDPVEYVYQSKRCMINQRELHRDTQSFSTALRSALREDPDVILVGEMRDLETMRLVLTAAETGHLVFSTLHTNSASKTIDRMIDVFPGEEKNNVRSMLSESLQAVISQHLVKKVKGGRTLALEMMVCNNAIRNLIREDKIAQMYSAIQSSREQGMITLDQHLMQLVKKGIISKQTARSIAVYKNNL